MAISPKTYRKILDALKARVAHPIALEVDSTQDIDQLVSDSFFAEYGLDPEEVDVLVKKLKFEEVLEDFQIEDQEVYRIDPFRMYRFYDSVISSKGQLVEYNGDPMTISFGGRSYKIRAKEKAAFFSVLWYRKKEIDSKNEVVSKGESISKQAMAANLGGESSSRKVSDIIRTRIKNMTSDLNRIFKENKFPMRIDGRAGIQLIVDYSQIPRGLEKDWNHFKEITE